MVRKERKDRSALLAAPEQYRAELLEKLDELNRICEEAWGMAPDLEPRVEPAIAVTCDFDLGDFPHKGKNIMVHPGNIGKRGPGGTAREIMREVVSHRNLCNRCGVPVKHIRYRTRLAERETREQGKTDLEELQPPDRPEELLFPKQAKRLNAALEIIRGG